MPHTPKTHSPGATAGRDHTTEAREKRVQRFDPAFYGKSRWRRLRRRYLARHPLCQRCSTDQSPVLAEHVDHIEPRRQRPDLSLQWSNLRSLCVSCHSTVTIADTRRRATETMGTPPPPLASGENPTANECSPRPGGARFLGGASHSDVRPPLTQKRGGITRLVKDER